MRVCTHSQSVPAPPLQPIRFTDNNLVMNNLCRGGMFQNKWALESNIFAYSERTQHATYFKKSDHSALTGECAFDPKNCAHRVCAFADASTNQFKVTHFTGHNPTCPKITGSTLNPRSAKGDTFKPHRFSANSLAVLVLPHLAETDNPDIKTLKPVLEGYVRQKMTDAFVRKVVQCAKELTSLSNYLPCLPALIEELERLGFIAGFETCDATEMVKIMKARARADYELDKKKAKEMKVTIEAYKGPDISGVTPHGRYVKCVWWIPPTTINMQAHGVLSNVSSADAAHMSTPSGVSEGTMYSMYGNDANRHQQPYFLMYSIENESTATWAYSFRKVKENFTFDKGEYPDAVDIDSQDTIVIMDADKGMASAFDMTFKEARRFMCEDHRDQNVHLLGGGAKSAAMYKNLVRTTTKQKFDKVWNKNPDATWAKKAREYMQKEPLERQFPLKLKESAPDAEGLHGHSASQGVESMNNANIAARSFGGDFVSWLMKSLELAMKRFYENRLAAEKDYEDQMPPKILKKIKEMQEGNAYASISGVVELAPKVKYRVVFSTVPEPGNLPVASHRIVTFGESPDCTCGGPKLHDFPCEHLLRSCDSAGVLPHDLLHTQDTVATWKKQYEVAGEFTIPDTSCMEDAEPTAGLLLPLATPPPRGGVSRKRKDCAIRRIKDARKKQTEAHAASVGVPPPPPPG